jgi:hypothetical protein
MARSTAEITIILSELYDEFFGRDSFDHLLLPGLNSIRGLPFQD